MSTTPLSAAPPPPPLAAPSDGSSDRVGVDERKRKRKELNRDSARRCRMRKQEHVENLRKQATRLGIENRDLMNRARFIRQRYQIIERDNDRLRSEYIVLQYELNDLRRRLVLRQLMQQCLPAWQCNHNNNYNDSAVGPMNERILPYLTSVNEQSYASLVA